MTPKINWKPTNTDLRKFGLTILVGFGLIGWLIHHRGNSSLASSIWAVSSAVGFLALVLPPLSRPFYWAWMLVALIMGSVMSRVVMTVIFIVVITPVALFFRLTGRDVLKRRKPKADAGSYWTEHPVIDDKESYNHLF